MATSISATNYSRYSYIPIAELNNLFQQIAMILDNKIDLRGDVVESDLIFTDGAVINTGSRDIAGSVGLV